MGAGLSGIIEYIASLQRPNGGHIASQAHRQDLIVGFPPNVPVYYQTGPTNSQYAMIVYNYQFGNMEPNVFSYSLNYTGWFVSNGIFTEDVIDRNIDFFMVATTANPIRLYVTNRDVIPHAYEASLYYLTIGTSDDLHLIAEALGDRGGTSAYLAEILKALHGTMPEREYGLPTPIYTG